MLQTVRPEKVDEKNGLICIVSMFPFWVLVLHFSKKLDFFASFCNFISIKAIYKYVTEKSR